MMKVAIFTLVSVVLSRAIQGVSGDVGFELEKRYEERRLPHSEVELLYMMNHLTVNLRNALKYGVSPERWHMAKITLKTVEKSVQRLDAVLTAEEKLQINNEVNLTNLYLVPSGDLQVKEVCDQGFEDFFCAYYNFTSYAQEVTNLAKMAKTFNDLHLSKSVSDEKTTAELKDRLSLVRDEMEQIEVAPIYLWKKEPKFEETQKSFQQSEKLVSEVAAYLKENVD